MADDQTINVPQLLLVLLLGGFAIRYFFFGPASSTTRTVTSGHQLRAREADVERIQQMFPQIARRSIMWDLQRNGGSVAATTERILSGRGLDNPPQTFQPLMPVPGSTSSTSNSAAARKEAPPDLITRYNLADKIASGEETLKESIASKPGSKKEKSWSTDASQRQSLLQKRREEMILEARRKMEAKLKAQQAQEANEKAESTA